MFDLEGKAALVTGASGGIGGAIARALHAQGAAVALSGTRKEALDAVAGELGHRAAVVPCDLSDAAAAAAASDRSQGTTAARWPSSPATASKASLRVPESATAAPWACNARAIAPPIPPEAPVTRAAFPSKSNMTSPFVPWVASWVSDCFEQRFDLGRRAHRLGAQLPIYAPRQSAQDLA